MVHTKESDMAKALTRERCIEELRRTFSRFDGNMTFFGRIIDRMDSVDPQWMDDTYIYRRRYGLIDTHNPTELSDLARELKLTNGQIKAAHKRVQRRLQNPLWWSEETWPRPAIDMSLPRMSNAEIARVAIRLLKWQYRYTSHKEFTVRLIAACKDLRISEDDRQRFLREIADLDKK